MGLFDRLFGKKETPKVAEEKLEENLLTGTTQKEELSEKANEQNKIEVVQQEDVFFRGRRFGGKWSRSSFSKRTG
ncbi:signal recognition particle-docking protein FtsY [Streptococcus pyogenes]|nr:signal recognition particle-docking protein FtsY [Streptococcus pyogenes]